MIEGLKQYREYKDSGLPWLGNVPAHWVTKRGKSFMTAIDRRSQAGKEELLTVSSSRGVIPRNTAKVTMFKAESYAGYKLCWPGDLVINSLWAWAGGLGVTQHHGIISTAYSVYRPRQSAKMNPRFLHDLVRSSSFKWELHVRSKGIWISRLQLTDTAFLDAPIPLPPPDEQAAIVLFLDYANRKIDGFIRAKRKLIGLLNEQKQAIIHRAVTRGLHPDVPLKSSGIPWLGDIPMHWEVRRMKYLLKEIDNRSSDGSETLLRVSQYTGITPRMAQDGSGEADTRAESLVGYKRVQHSDMVINIMLAWNGSLAVSEDTGIVSPAYCVYRFNEGLFPWFFHHLLRTTTYKGRIRVASTGVIESRLRLYSDALGRIEAIVPPEEEQQAICDSILGETRHLTTAIARTEREIALMQEYRTRLTADLVTGKLDVREAAAKLPDTIVEGNAVEPSNEISEESAEEILES